MLDKKDITETNKIPPVLDTARNIVEYRISTSTNRGYISWQNELLEKIELFPRLGVTKSNWLKGIIGESLFYESALFSNIPIRISNGKEDRFGTDFFLLDYPIDVTTDPTDSRKKIDPRNCTTLFLPEYIGQRSIFNEEDYGTQGEKYLHHYLTNPSLPNEEYLIDTYFINYEISNLMEEEIDSKIKLPFLKNSGENNLCNLRTILNILEDSIPWHPLEAPITDHPVPVLLT